MPAKGLHTVALLRSGAAIGRVSSQGLSCLDVAAWNGHTGPRLQTLTAPEATSDRKRRCSLALYFAAKANKPRTIHDLIALGANVNQRRLGLTILHYTAGRGFYEAAEALLKAGANVGAKNEEGNTPLHRACISSHPSTVQLLLRWGADESVGNNDDQIPSNLVGTAGVLVPLTPEEMDVKLLRDESIRKMLVKAPADRIWRRRGWLVLCRARWLARVAENNPPPDPNHNLSPRFCSALSKKH